jgi:hypothetical protein
MKLIIVQSDLEALIERSFSMVETHYRAKYRRLQWHADATNAFSTALHTEEKASNAARTRPRSTASVAESQTSCAESEACGEDDDDIDRQEAYSQEQHFTLERFRRPDSESEDLPSLHPDTSSNATPSVASWSSKSNNPFLRSVETPRLKIDVAQSLAGFPQNIWDGPMPSYPAA